MWTYIEAVAAFFNADTLHFHPVELGWKSLRFRAVAPQAMKRTSLHKQSQTDTRTVMNRKALHIVKLTGKFFLFFHIEFLHY